MLENKKRNLEEVLQELRRYGSPYQRVVIWVDDFDHFYDTTVDGAHVAIGDMSKLMVESVNNDNTAEKWEPVMIYCKTQS